MQQEGKNTWGGPWKYKTCNVNIDFQVKYNTPSLNTINIVDTGPIKRSAVNGNVLSDRVTNVNDGLFDIRDFHVNKNGKNVPAYVHEFGHLMGLLDRYQDINKKSQAFPGWENNIMGNNIAEVEQRDINMLIEINFTKQQIQGCGC